MSSLVIVHWMSHCLLTSTARCSLLNPISSHSPLIHVLLVLAASICQTLKLLRSMSRKAIAIEFCISQHDHLSDVRAESDYHRKRMKKFASFSQRPIKDGESKM